MQWVESLPDSQTPSWLGLPNNAEKVLLTNKGIIAEVKLKSGQIDFTSSIAHPPLHMYYHGNHTPTQVLL